MKVSLIGRPDRPVVDVEVELGENERGAGGTFVIGGLAVWRAADGPYVTGRPYVGLRNGRTTEVLEELGLADAHAFKARVLREYLRQRPEPEPRT